MKFLKSTMVLGAAALLWNMPTFAQRGGLVGSLGTQAHSTAGRGISLGGNTNSTLNGTMQRGGSNLDLASQSNAQGDLSAPTPDARKAAKKAKHGTQSAAQAATDTAAASEQKAEKKTDKTTDKTMDKAREVKVPAAAQVDGSTSAEGSSQSVAGVSGSSKSGSETKSGAKGAEVHSESNAGANANMKTKRQDAGVNASSNSSVNAGTQPK